MTKVIELRDKDIKTATIIIPIDLRNRENITMMRRDVENINETS